MKFVINRRRSGPVRSSADWKVVAEFDTRAVALETEIPSDIMEHWLADKSPLGYARLKGLTLSQLRHLVALSRSGGVVRLGINRMGDVHAYKVLSKMQFEGLLPMPPQMGPPLPRSWDRTWDRRARP
jgi:hypothetical protein